MHVSEVADRLVRWLGQEARQREARGFVVGISGGIDSAVTAALCKRANPDHTLGIIMPCHSDPRDAEDARMVADALGVKAETVVLDEPFELMVQRLTGKPYQPGVKDLSILNIKPRLRMTTLYYFAAVNRSLVVGTGNRCELAVGYFTKYGDGGADLLPIARLVKSQVNEMAEYLEVPRRIIDKAPSAGLWAGQNDEVEMGITYSELDNYILTGQAQERVRDVFENLSARSEHKRQMPALPPFYNDGTPSGN